MNLILKVSNYLHTKISASYPYHYRIISKTGCNSNSMSNLDIQVGSPCRDISFKAKATKFERKDKVTRKLWVCKIHNFCIWVWWKIKSERKKLGAKFSHKSVRLFDLQELVLRAGNLVQVRLPPPSLLCLPLRLQSERCWKSHTIFKHEY